MLLLAHLTDIHIHSDIDPVLERSDQIGAAIASQSSGADAIAIVLTGDIAYSGAWDQYELALAWLGQIEKRIREDFDGPLKFVVTPGNHDCDFSIPQDLRNLVLKQIAEKPDAEHSRQYIDACLAVQENFFRFAEMLTGTALEGSQRLRHIEQLEHPELNVSFDCLNVSWVSQLHEDKVTFPATILPTQRTADGVVVTIMHHPFNWLHPSAYREFRRRVRANSDFIFSGHEHKWNVIETVELEAGRCIQFEGHVLQDPEADFSGFSVIELETKLRQYRARAYQWTGARYEQQDAGNWTHFRSFELTSPADSWVFTKGFGHELSDLGVSLRVGGKAEVAVEDVFVFPDLESATEDEEAASIHGDSILRDQCNERGFVIQGDERSGRSTLLKHLVRRYADEGKVPILVPGTLLTRATEGDLDAALARLVKQQYAKNFDEYLQLPKSKRVLIVDDFDEVPIKSEKAKWQLLARLNERCATLVLAVSDVFEAAHLVTSDDAAVFERLPKFRILPFGRLSRARLISKWVTLDSDEFLDEETRIRRIDEATKYVDLVMSWKVVPSYPVYLLTLLQAEKTGSPESFKDSGLGYYYQYLISEAMLNAGVRKEELTEVDQYCSQLAWLLRKIDRSYLSMDELADFEREFSSQWVALDFNRVRRLLLDSKILNQIGDVIEFRYGYIYYFFVAKYLAENFDEAESRAFISTASSQLYVRANANILIFLTHFTNNVLIVDSILSTLTAQFAGTPLAQFALRNESVEAMLRQVPQIVYEGGDPVANREEEARHRDSLGESSDGLVERADEIDALGLSARLTIVFKAIEILGQILKTQYSKIQRSRREVIVRDMIREPLRALEVFYEGLRTNPEALVSEFEKRLAHETGEQSAESRRALAQRVVASLVLGVTFGFFRKVSIALGSDSVSGDLRSVVEADAHLGEMLIRLATTLDGQRPLPRVDIERVRKLGAGSLIVDRMVQVLVVYHMYMYRMSYSDIRWAHDVLGIPNSMKVKAIIGGGQLDGPDAALRKAADDDEPKHSEIMPA